MQKDHGYNPPPVWGMTGKFFGSFAPAGDTYFKILSAIDVAFHVGIVLLFYWAFGYRVMAVAIVFWGCNAPANFYWTGGAFLRQDWLFFLVAAVCCAQAQVLLFPAARSVGFGALLRIFPIIFFVVAAGHHGAVLKDHPPGPLRHIKRACRADRQALDQARSGGVTRLPAPGSPPPVVGRDRRLWRARPREHGGVRRRLVQAVLRPHHQGAQRHAADQPHGARDHARPQLERSRASCATGQHGIATRSRAGSRADRAGSLRQGDGSRSSPVEICAGRIRVDRHGSASSHCASAYGSRVFSRPECAVGDLLHQPHLLLLSRCSW